MLRMRLHRAPRLAGLRCLTLDIRDAEIAALIRNDLLHSDSEHDGKAIRTALCSYLDRQLGGGM